MIEIRGRLTRGEVSVENDAFPAELENTARDAFLRQEVSAHSAPPTKCRNSGLMAVIELTVLAPFEIPSAQNAGP